MNKITLKIHPSSSSNDHQVRILIDNEDILGRDYLGIDPPDFFNQLTIEKNGILIIGRCTCGVEGCGDYPVNVAVNENTISWTNNNGLNLTFDKSDYINTFKNSRNDFSWEDINRKVERLTTNILKNTQTIDKYSFQWASSRIKKKLITVSYSKNGDQRQFDIKWNGKTEDKVETNALEFMKTLK